MERLMERIDAAERALLSFEQIMGIASPSLIERDAAIQRFEYTFEAVWKAAKQMLFDIDGVDIGSPKGVVRSCRELGLLNDVQSVMALEMVDDRNLTVHTYNEMLAATIFEHMRNYVVLLRQWVEGIKGRTSEIENSI